MFGNLSVDEQPAVSQWPAEIWSRSIVNEAAAASPYQPIVNMGQGFFGYNPPPFVIDAAKSVLDKVDCNQYSHTKVRRLSICDRYMLQATAERGCRAGHVCGKRLPTHTLRFWVGP